LSIEHPKPAAFGDEDVRNIELLAASAAVAIENARRYGETAQQLAARTALAWTGMVGSTWRHAVGGHARTIREEIQLLRSDVANKSKADVVGKRLEKIERLANQILERPITPPLSAEEGVHSLPINDFLRERTRQLWAHEPYKNVSLKMSLGLDELATVRVSPEWLRRALDILIDNAVEATTGLPERKVVISGQRRGNCAEISIADNGHGIPPGVQERLFREPIKKPQGAKGQGIGLLLAQMIVQTYGGAISCRETGPTGTTMVISLPLEA
jgi:signal transduction histidine kinase